MHRQSGGKDIVCGVDITIMDRRTFGTGPDTDIKRKGFQNMTTIKASFGGRVPLVNLDQRPSIACRLVVQLAHELPPSHITDGFAQVTILDHVLDVQTLDAYDLVLAYDLSREFLLGVAASIGDTSVDPGDFASCLVPVLGAFAFLREAALCPCQFALIFGKELGVAVSMSIGGDDDAFQPQVQPDHFRSHRQGVHVFFNEHGDEVAPRTVLRDRDARRLASIGQGTRPHDVKGCLHPGKREVCPIPLEGTRGVGCRLDPMFLLESRVLGTSFEEVEKGAVQVTQCLLQRDTGNFIEPRGFILLFQIGQGARQMSVVETFPLLVVGVRLLAQAPIVDVAHTAKGPSQHLLLLVGGVPSILVGALLFHGLQYSS